MMEWWKIVLVIAGGAIALSWVLLVATACWHFRRTDKAARSEGATRDDVR